MYNKLFSKILDSSIWLESDTTRLCWLTCLAVMDEDGFVQFASVANLAHRARVSLEAAQGAIKRLEGPDPDSSDPEKEGRRLERVPGGWIVMNAGKYRELVTRFIARERTKERVRRHRSRTEPEADVTPCNALVTVGNDPVTPSEAYTEAKTDVHTAPSIDVAPPAGAGPPTAQDVVVLWNNIITAPIPKVAKLTSDRKRKIEARLKTYPDLATWRTCIRWLNGQEWCRASGTGDHANWTATLDWLTRKDGEMARMLERVAAEAASPSDELTRRAESFCERYRLELYPQFLKVAYVVNRPVQDRDLEAATRLCMAYTDEQLDQVAETFLQIPDDRERFLKGKTRTVSMLVTKAPAIAERLAITPQDRPAHGEGEGHGAAA